MITRRNARRIGGEGLLTRCAGSGRARLALVGIKDIYMRHLAGQLGHPRGINGRVVGRVLNLVNRGPVTGSVAAMHVTAGQTVADIGFGGGVGLRLLLEQVGPQGRVYGVDMSATALAGARRRFRVPLADGRLRLLQATMDRIALPDATFDAIATVNTIYYVPDAAVSASLTELARLLRPGGRLVLGMGDPDFMATMPWSVGVLRLRPISAVTDALGEAGFTITDHGRLGDGWRAFHTLTAELAQ